MGELEVGSVGIEGLLGKIRSNSWLVPTFQRDFVWSEADVTGLCLSILDARPIGMATLWEQPDSSSGLDLAPVSIYDTKDGLSVEKALSPSGDRPKKYFAILDGRQRCTAIAMAFGGLRPDDTRRRFAGRWFLNVATTDETEKVVYLKEREVKSRGLDVLGTCIRNGLFPLACSGESGLLKQWVGYLQALMNPANYPAGEYPDEIELKRRNDVLTRAFDGLNHTLLAIYTVPDQYGLGEICEIFETLNTTGTKVSTVDLLHSWLYADTVARESPIQLRDWIDDLGQQEGAMGWASRSSRPELIAQIATASYLLLDAEKSPARSVGRRNQVGVTSLKAGDLLATPAEFWIEFTANRDLVAGYLDGFQSAVAEANFPMSFCPYPVTSAIYVGLRWYMDHDSHYVDQWSTHELDALFRAFFWRNSLGGRYDQGFLTQSAADMKLLKDLLFLRAQSGSANEWATQVSERLAFHGMRPPGREDLVDWLLDARPAGALGLALGLPVWTRPRNDLVDPEADISYPFADQVELHHLFPRDWCRNNRHGVLQEVLDPTVADHDYVRSVANLTPLTRESNNTWRAQQPGQVLAEMNLTPQNSGDRLARHFISTEAYSVLLAATPDPEAFWRLRARDIADDLLSRCEVQL